MARLADMHADVPWSYRPIFSFLAGQNPGSIFSLSAARADVLKADRADDRVDADELPVLKMPSREEIEADYAPGGLVNRMYPTYEPRDEQIEMAVEVRDALVTGTHRVIEAGTGVGKSMAYLVPFAEAARRNNITVGIATKSNNLADQLMYHELPKLAEQLDGGLSFCALKGYDHYPCLRKLERMSRGQVEITTKRDPADTLTAVAVIMAYVCQSADGDLDSLGIRWRSVNRPDFTTASRECARRLCPFFLTNAWSTGRAVVRHMPTWWSPTILCCSATWPPRGGFCPRFVTGWSTRPIPSSARPVANGRAWFRQMSRACCLSAWVGRVPAR